jgi:tRNA 2-thiouridine synthesizing protein E
LEIEIAGRVVHTDEQGFLLDMDEWSEEFVEKTAETDGIRLYDDHWGLILYFRDYWQSTGSVPTMHVLVRSLGRQHGAHFHDEKTYTKFLYRLFPSDPVRTLCKLAGLPRPPPDD